MDETDRKNHWDRVYDSKNPGEVSWFQAEPELSMQLIENAGLRHQNPIIDIGGGASRLVERLFAQGYNDLTVLDISPVSLAHAKAQLGKKAETVDWIVADITRFKPTRKYALWHDRAVFHFLTERADRMKYVAALNQALPAGGDVVLAAFALDGPTKCSGLDIVQYDSQKLLNELGKEFSLVEEATESHVTPGGGNQAFSYFRLKRSR